jgi:ABC-type uncharacterized transport system substrate-binding protein
VLHKEVHPRYAFDGYPTTPASDLSISIFFHQWRPGAASYVDRILKGEKPGDLPVQAPTRYEFVINLKTAKALGLTISREVQLTADEVID